MAGTALGLVVMCLTLLTTSIMCKITILLLGLREYAALNNITTSQFGVIHTVSFLLNKK